MPNADTKPTSIEESELMKSAEIAGGQPASLVKAMAERDGLNNGGLTLSREHIITINKYVNHVYSLPEREKVQDWLGYATIDEAELTPDSMAVLFATLRAHADTWRPLSDASKGLASQLGSTANVINTTGELILDECKRVKSLGTDIKTWQEVALAKPVELELEEKKTVSGLSEYIEELKKTVQAYAADIDTVKSKTQTFRDEISNALLGAVAMKVNSIERKQGDNEVERLRRELAEIDETITNLKKEYEQYLSTGLGTLAGGPLVALIGGTIYGVRAETVRHLRYDEEAKRRKCVEDLHTREALEARLRELHHFTDVLDARLRDVLTSASHLHTAWGHVDAYVASAEKCIKDIKTRNSLALFILSFKVFLGQWKEIERASHELTRVFDDAAAAH